MEKFFTGAIVVICFFAFFAVVIGFGVFMQSIDDARTIRMTKACKEFGLIWKGNTCQ